MKRILVPTDFSPTAERAFRVAMDISKKTNGTVILYHAHKPEKSEFLISTEEKEQYTQQTETNLLKKLQRLKKKVTDGTNEVPVSTIVGRTPVVDNILGFAEYNHIDMIVMGTQGASGLRKTIIGSVASKVTDNADIPVLLVPEKYAWQEPKRFVYASNYVHSEKKALSQFLALANLYNAKVTVIHFVNAYLNLEEKEKERTAFDTYAFYLNKEFKNSELNYKLLESDSVIESMEKLDKKIPFDIFAMVRRNKGFYEKFFLGSFTKNMAYITKQLLLIIPEIKLLEAEKEDKIIIDSDYIPMPHDNLQIEKIIKRKSE